MARGKKLRGCKVFVNSHRKLKSDENGSELLNLPDEIWLQILGNVSQADLNNVSLANKKMSSLACDKSLWKRVKLNRGGLVGVEAIRAFFQNPKLQSVVQIHFSFSGHEWTIDELLEVLKQCLASSTIEELILDLDNVDMEKANVPAELLAKVIAKMKVVYLDGDLTMEQINLIFERAAESSTLTDLDLGKQNTFETVSTKSLVKTFSKLQKVYIYEKHPDAKKYDINKNCTLSQGKAIVERLKMSTALEELYLQGNVLSTVPSSMLSDITERLHSIHLVDLSLTREQYFAIFQLLDRSTSLKEFEFLHYDQRFANIPEDLTPLMANVISKMRIVSIDGDLSCNDKMSKAVFEKLETSTTLKELSLRGIISSGVPPSLLYKIMKKLTKVALHDFSLTFSRAVQIFKGLAESSSLVDFQIFHFDDRSENYTFFKALPESILFRIIVKLQKIKVIGIDFTQIQLISIFRALSENTSIKKVALVRMNHFPKELLDQTVKCLEERGLTIRNHGCITFKKKIIKNNTWKCITQYSLVSYGDFWDDDEDEDE